MIGTYIACSIDKYHFYTKDLLKFLFNNKTNETCEIHCFVFTHSYIIGYLAFEMETQVYILAREFC